MTNNPTTSVCSTNPKCDCGNTGNCTRGPHRSICLHPCQPREEAKGERCACWPKSKEDVACRHYINAVASGEKPTPTNPKKEDWEEAFDLLYGYEGDGRTISFVSESIKDSIRHLLAEARREQHRLAVAEERRKNGIPANDILRSLYLVVVREGKDTNWEALKKNVSAELERQHVYLSSVYGEMAHELFDLSKVEPKPDRVKPESRKEGI